MSNTDPSAQNVRFNLDSRQLEFAVGLNWTVVPGLGGSPGGGVGALQFNNSGSFGGSSITIGESGSLRFAVGDDGAYIYPDTGNTVPHLSINADSGIPLYIGGSDAPVVIVAGDAFSDIADSAALQIPSTTKGFLPPVMSEANRDAIATPAEGLIIYNLTSHKLNVYTTEWEEITSAA